MGLMLGHWCQDFCVQWCGSVTRSGSWEMIGEDDSIAESDTSVRAPSLGVLSSIQDQASPKPPPIPRLRAWPVFSSTPPACLQMKRVRARGLRNKFPAEKPVGRVALGKNQTQSQDVRARLFLPGPSGGGTVGPMELGSHFQNLTGAVFTEPRKAGAGKHTRFHTLGVMHGSMGLSGLQYLLSELHCEARGVM